MKLVKQSHSECFRRARCPFDDMSGAVGSRYFFYAPARADYSLFYAEETGLYGKAKALPAFESA